MVDRLEVLADLDHSFAWRVVEELSRRFGEVLAGSAKEEEMALYLQGLFSEAGIGCEVYRLPALVSWPGESVLEVLSPAAGASRLVPSVTFSHSESTTPTTGIEAEVAYVGAGGYADYAGQTVQGKVVLAELSYSPPRPEKARIAKEKGAVGLILINWGRDTDRALPKGTVKSVWGNPTRQTWPGIATLPAVGVTRPDGLRLKAMAQEGALRVRLMAQAQRAWREVRLPLAWVGEERAAGREFVLMAGHYDAWGGGVTDNHCGVAGMVTVARALHAHRQQLRRDVAFAFWPAHESGIMDGSTWFADRFWDELRARCVAYINVDSIGMRDTSVWYAARAAELEQLVDEVGRALVDKPTEGGRPPKTGDQSFFGLGIPSLVARSAPGPDQVRDLHGAVLGWWYQSDQDTLDKLDRATFVGDIGVLTAYAWDLASSALLPFSADGPALEISRRLAEIEQELAAKGAAPGADGLEWASLRAEADRFVSLGGQLQRRLVGLRRKGDTPPLADAEALNACLMRMARLTIPVRYAAVDRYQQDTYGQSRLVHVLPEMDSWLEFVGAGGDEAHLLWSEAARARNRLADALREANAVLRTTLAALPDG